MRTLASAALAVALAACATRQAPVAATGPAPSDPDMARAVNVLRTTPLVDTHNDLPWEIRRQKAHPFDVAAYDLRARTAGMTDIARLRQGMVGAQFWSVYVPGEIADSGFARVQLEQIDIARRTIAAYPDVLAPAYTAADIRREFRAGRIASLIGMEGGHAIENSLGALRAYYDLGARYMTLTHNVTLDWADAALDSARHGGLTPFGEEVVREMNRLGMLVDLSHVSPATMSDALNVAEAPVIFSHSSARALVDVPRNVPDSILRRLKDNGGVVMVTFVTSFSSADVARWGDALDRAAADARRRFPDDSARRREALAEWRRANPQPKATLKQVADHIEHVRDVAGIDHVGLGGDFDGITETIEGLEDVSAYPRLLAELARRGWSDDDLRKLAGENLLRAMQRAEEVSTRLRRERQPSTKTIAALDGARVPARSSEEREVLAAVTRLFDAMYAGDSAGVRRAFVPAPQFLSVGARDGRAQLRVDSLDAFVRAVGTPHAQAWDERVANETVHVDGALASAWMDYTFYLGGTLSHCGVDAFQLFKGADGWKIASIADTRRRGECPALPKTR